MTTPADDPSEVRTARLLLRRPAEADAPFVLALHSDPRTTSHDPSDALDDLAEAIERIRLAAAAHADASRPVVARIRAENTASRRANEAIGLARRPDLDLGGATTGGTRSGAPPLPERAIAVRSCSA